MAVKPTATSPDTIATTNAIVSLSFTPGVAATSSRTS